MPITIVSAPSASQSLTASDKTADVSADSATGAQGFVSLFLEQLFQVAGDDSATAQSSILAGEESAASDSKTTDDTEGTQDDAAALLAALGMIPVEQRADRAADSASTGGQTQGDVVDIVGSGQASVSDSSSTGKLASTLANLAAGEGKEQPIAASGPSTSDVDSAALTADDKAAKFAVLAGSAQNENTLKEGSSAKSTSVTEGENSATVAQPLTHSTQTQTARDTATSVPTAFRDQNWSTDFSQKVVMLASSHKQSAELTLNPPHMGTVEISLQVDNDKATATFASPHASVREAIENALPRLREMFAGVGIELGQANVSSESFRQATGQEYGSNNTSQSTGDNAILTDDSQAVQSIGSTSVASRAVGLVDLFA